MQRKQLVILSPLAFWLLLSPASAQSDLKEFPAVKKALTDPEFASKLGSDAERAEAAPKGSPEQSEFVRLYLKGDRGKLRDLGESYRKFCLPGPGEGCGAARHLLSGGHYDGCIGGVGEGCGQGPRQE